MKVKSKKLIGFFFMICVVLLSYFIWQSTRPVVIVAVHESGSHASVLVENFPFMDKGKINWWLKNQGVLKNKYGIPKPDQDGYFTIVFWYFGDGYKEEDKYDRRCFEDLKTTVNCIEKDKAFTVWMDRYGNVSFGVSDGEYYINRNGEMVKEKY